MTRGFKLEKVSKSASRLFTTDPTIATREDYSKWWVLPRWEERRVVEKRRSDHHH